ncbi:hypothetical protein KBK19_14180 [Microvirga sp. STR05]|uniref:Phage integrase SAM-like domain-containing protein n=1 Tax=Hymenobacter duratus TaxID=2771356 RepID=A0ABR8JKE6_9BACT|nr:hypothetical protein [Hymenobacter duratus]MBD2716186.1 hypothetical protein [Hymenobacter duratus]MBR7951100.1 hypothetical protein [Microvirga sp. STR05]
MKTSIDLSHVLTLSVNGASITPELARPFTKKRDGHHVMLRVTANRKAIAYLSTDLYVMPPAFNTRTKQLSDPDDNETLHSLLSRAGKVVANTLIPDQLKASWERERKAMHGESMVDAMEQFAEWNDYGQLINRAATLEKELATVQAAIKKMELDNPGLTAVPTATLHERKQYEAAMTAFLREHQTTLSKRDYQMWTTWQTRLNETATHNKLTLSLFSFDLEFYACYKKYLMGVRGNKLSTFGAHVKRLKGFLKWCEGNGYSVGNGWKHKKFAITEEEKEVVYLDDHELNLLWDFQHIKPEYTKQIHMCLFQSLTGLRISDVTKTHHIKTLKVKSGIADYLTAKCQKTEGTYKVPLSLDTRIKEILTLNNFNMKLMSEKHYNKTIKLIVKELYEYHNMEMPVEQIETERVDGKKYVEEVQKNLLLATHSNRRSFISRHINSTEFSHIDVMEMLGSTDLKELQKYIKIDNGALNDKAAANATTRMQHYMRVA